MDDTLKLMRRAKRLHFPDVFEKLFQEDYYQHSIALCRTALAASLVIWLAFGFLDPYTLPSATGTVWLIRFALVGPFYGGILLWSFFPSFRRFMQPAISLGLLVVGFGLLAITALSHPTELGYLFYPIGLLLECMVGYSFLRLRFWCATIPNLILIVAYVCLAIFYQKIFAVPQGLPIFINNLFFILGANIAGAATCYSLELYARRAFVANYLLDQERAGERRQRERTEAMLQVLSQAIGGVVHDLGNPLTSVQVGAETLEMFLENGDTDLETLKEFTSIIRDGAGMLNYLRLSLMEQTRVLEGKPIPVDLKPVSVRRIVEAGLHYQKPRFVNGRQLSLDGDDMEFHVDERKMTTVLMNLIGNALKYSDGEVRVSWRATQNTLLIAIADHGMAGNGISKAQADLLFVAFGRLDAHAEVEGTGLGLLSVRKIVEAHGGEVFIEGHTEEMPSAIFSTAQGVFPSMLDGKLRTAFVVACPLPLQP